MTPPLLPEFPEPIVKRFRGGTHRLIAPEDTLARVSRWMPVMGITRLANITGLDRIGIPVVVCCRPNSRSLAVSQGKGLDLASARVSALMESVESYHAEHITHPLKLASFEELRYTHSLVDVEQLPRTSQSRFHPHLPLLWIEGHELLSHTRMWVPYELVHTNYTHPKPSGHGCFIASSNGLASGNHPIEAISHALCEVIERDATALWYLREDPTRTRVDLDTVDDPGCREVLELYRRAGVAVAVWETTSDLEVPAFLCLITEDEAQADSKLHSAAGMGCHPVRAVAMLRALTEAAQSRLTVIAGSRDDIIRDDYETSRSPYVLRRDREVMTRPGPMRAFRDGPDFAAATFNEDLAWLLGRLRARGLEQVLVTDLSRPEFGISVARVVVPGLEGLSSVVGYVPGRRARAAQELRQ